MHPYRQSESLFVVSIYLILRRCAGIDHKKNIIITSSHPSPLSAYKTDEPFIGSRYDISCANNKSVLVIILGNRIHRMFSRCNEALESLGKETIDWNIR